MGTVIVYNLYGLNTVILNRMSFFEMLYENNKQKEKDRQYLSQAFSNEGRRYSADYHTKPNLLGKGGYGFVRMSRRKSKPDTTENCLATKVIAKDTLEDWQSEEGSVVEAQLLMRISHKNILKVYSLYQNSHYYLMVMEMCSGVTLFDLIELNHHLEENVARIIFRQVLDAVLYLHSNGIVHNDIKDENIIVNTELKVTIIDFGSACMDTGEKTRIYCGSETYTSPEVISGSSFYRVGQEIWSLGILLFVMVYGQNPFDNVVKAEECILIFPSLPPVSQMCRHLVSSVLTRKVTDRPSVLMMYQWDWVTAVEQEHQQINNNNNNNNTQFE